MLFYLELIITNLHDHFVDRTGEVNELLYSREIHQCKNKQLFTSYIYSHKFTTGQINKNSPW